ncbi:MAG TPA: DMT family transporter [Thermoanaerobaculia bacterium]|jgi:drug/metabolite transporter (DMT)-like permease
MKTDLERAPLQIRWRADAVLIAVSLVWGADFVLVKSLLGRVPPLPFLFWRFALATFVGALFLPGRRRTPGLLWDSLLLGGLSSVGMGLQIVGQAHTTASNASFLTGLASVMTPLAAFLLFRRLPTLENGIGISLAGAGFVLMTFPAAGAPVNRGDLLVFGCAVAWAFYVVELAERSPRHDAAWLTTIQLGVVAVASGVAALLVWGPDGLKAGIVPLLGAPSLILQFVLLATVGTTATFLFQAWAQGQMSATHAAIIFTLEPIVTALLAAWFLGERLGPRGWAGGALVLAGIVVAETRLRRGH